MEFVLNKLRILPLALCAVVAITTARVHAQSNEKISDDLLQSDGTQEVLIVLDQLQFGEELRYMTKEDRGTYVFNALQNHARQSQAEVNGHLDEKGAAYRPFYIVNMVEAWLSPDEIQSVAKYASVKRIVSNDRFLMEEPVRGSTPDLRSAEPVWGIRKIQADSVWSLGITGEGIVVGGADTGYDWEHPSIKQKYRGNDGDTVHHSYSWHDAIHEINPLNNDTVIDPSNNPCGLNSVVPCDDHGHGTHTAGTMVGEDTTAQMGVAPGARWIGCRNMERGYGSPASYIECFEWFLAPTDTSGHNPDPLMAPHVINNSWSCPPMEGCNPDNFELMRQAIINLRAAGVVVVVSAGNNGSGCSTVNAPSAIFAESFAIGATNQGDTIANFSSRGPVLVDSSYRIKPDVVAPGVGVYSGWLNDSYRFLNGTSMAGPHVAGTVALMISANPMLAGQVETIEDILRETAVILDTEQVCDSIGDDQIPNNTYGYGRINALKAVEAALLISDVAGPSQPGLERFILSPNPATSQFTIRWDDPTATFDITLSTVDGRLATSFKQVSFNQTLDIDPLSDGLYFVTLSDSKTGELKGVEKMVVGR